MPQRIIYTNREGLRNSQVLKILRKKSKVITVQDPNDGHIFDIPRQAVESIEDPKKEK